MEPSHRRGWKSDWQRKRLNETWLHHKIKYWIGSGWWVGVDWELGTTAWLPSACHPARFISHAEASRRCKRASSIDFTHKHLCTVFNYTRSYMHMHKRTTFGKFSSFFSCYLFIKTMKMQICENMQNQNPVYMSPTVNEWASSPNLTSPWQQQFHTLVIAFNTTRITLDSGMWWKMSGE